LPNLDGESDLFLQKGLDSDFAKLPDGQIRAFKDGYLGPSIHPN